MSASLGLMENVLTFNIILTNVILYNIILDLFHFIWIWRNDVIYFIDVYCLFYYWFDMKQWYLFTSWMLSFALFLPFISFISFHFILFYRHRCYCAIFYCNLWKHNLKYNLPQIWTRFCIPCQNWKLNKTSVHHNTSAQDVHYSKYAQ